ncbi:integumentary mucin C.1, partial [Hyalella azteca]|uniref:Integumentary mucin C.1 n=1 Tax=Hyalella azteca TaxID=294128 RepID=A0A979FX08_HYAAZ
MRSIISVAVMRSIIFGSLFCLVAARVLVHRDDETRGQMDKKETLNLLGVNPGHGKTMGLSRPGRTAKILPKVAKPTATDTAPADTFTAPARRTTTVDILTACTASTPVDVPDILQQCPDKTYTTTTTAATTTTTTLTTTAAAITTTTTPTTTPTTTTAATTTTTTPTTTTAATTTTTTPTTTT